MSDLADTVSEAVERTRDEGGTGGDGGGTAKSGARMNLNAAVAISVAITATFTALCNVKDGNIVQAMQQAQASAIDAWAYYQAKGTKLNIAEAALDALRLQRDTAAALTPEASALIDRKLVEYEQKVRHYEQEKTEIKTSAEGFQKEYDRLNTHDDQFDMAEALASIAIALLGVTALTQKRGLLYVAWGFAGMGVILGLSGFLGLSLHPDFLARLLS
jgi:hypothetical protein